MKYTVVIEWTPNNYPTYVPDLPGCVATAGTRDEVLKEIREAMELHVEGIRRTANPYRSLGPRRLWWMLPSRQRDDM